MLIRDIEGLLGSITRVNVEAYIVGPCYGSLIPGNRIIRTVPQSKTLNLWKNLVKGFGSGTTRPANSTLSESSSIDFAVSEA